MFNRARQLHLEHASKTRIATSFKIQGGKTNNGGDPSINNAVHGRAKRSIHVRSFNSLVKHCIPTEHPRVWMPSMRKMECMCGAIKAMTYATIIKADSGCWILKSRLLGWSSMACRPNGYRRPSARRRIARSAPEWRARRLTRT